MTNSKAMTVLLVDSDLSILDEQAGLLQELGFSQTLQAEDGSEAWALYQSAKVDFIVCNLNLPQVNGLAFLRTVRSAEEFSPVPFVLVAREVTAKVVFQAGRAGVTDIIVQPYTGESFTRRIKTAIQGVDAPDSQEAERHYRHGLELMKAGRMEEALQSFEQILSVHENAEVYFNIGYIKAAHGQYEEALAFFQRATHINNHFALAYKKMADVYRAMGRQDLAESYLEKAGDIFLERKQDAEAEEVFTLLSDLKPDTTNVYNSLGIIYRRNGRWRDAVNMYEKALKVNPTNEYIYYNLSRVHLEAKDPTSAAEALRKALEVNPNFGPAKELAKALELGLTIS